MIRCVGTTWSPRSRVSNGVKAIAQLGRLACLSLLVGLSGCTSLALSDPSQWMGRGKHKEQPTRMVAVWTDAVMHQAGQSSVRGVGGRLLFYADRDEPPIEVHGTLTVFAYDDSSSAAPDAQPARKFVFRPDELGKRHSLSTLGNSYNVWLPWDEVGGTPRQLTLIARFEPEKGAVVMSDAAKQLLPGIPAEVQVSSTTVEPASYRQTSPQVAAEDDARADASVASDDSLETFTIDVPADVAKQWRQRRDRVLERTRSSTASERTTETPSQVRPSVRSVAPTGANPMTKVNPDLGTTDNSARQPRVESAQTEVDATHRRAAVRLRPKRPLANEAIGSRQR